MAHEGKGKELKEAFDKAWEKVPAHDKGEDKWFAADISVCGTNPINSYRVILRPAGS
jgi:hypothetical protein